jgi:hypothetical protein
MQFSIEIAIGIEHTGTLFVFDFDNDFDPDDKPQQIIPHVNVIERTLPMNSLFLPSLSSPQRGKGTALSES